MCWGCLLGTEPVSYAGLGNDVAGQIKLFFLPFLYTYSLLPAPTLHPATTTHCVAAAS